ncbi:UNVERIFIED_CONTAM: hypothetical protein KB574_09420 [Streptococcus canis]
MIPKYRAWDKYDEEMVNDIYFTWQDCQFESLNECLSFERFILMQSTGLFDKNGKEIFEGDLVKTKRFVGRANEISGFYEYEREYGGVVKMLEGAWLIDTSTDAIKLWSEVEENEVIGNIYDNPELVEL